MKILIQIGHKADQDMTGVANAFQEVGHKVTMWSEQRAAAFDVFNDAKPDLFIGCTGLVSRALAKCLNKFKPHTALFVENCENGKLEELTHDVSYVVEKDAGRKNQIVLPPCVNLTVALNPVKDRLLACDVLYVGSYQSCTRDINKYVLPLADKAKLRIFGPGNWPVPQSLGMVEYANVKNVMYNTKAYIHLFGGGPRWNVLMAIMAGTPVFTNCRDTLDDYGQDVTQHISRLGEYLELRGTESLRGDLHAIGYKLVTENYTNYHNGKRLFEAFGLSCTGFEERLAEKLKNG